MDDDALRETLRYMGIGPGTVGVVALLPLVQVAWADGEVQAKERTLIEDVARSRFALDGEGLHLLHTWLRHRPTDGYFHRGRQALVALARRASHTTRSDLDDIVAFSHDVAKAAGGVFGVGAVVPAEREVLAGLVADLDLPADSLRLLLDDLDEDDPEEDLDDPTDISGRTDLADVVREVSFGYSPGAAAADPGHGWLEPELGGGAIALREGMFVIGRGRDCDLQLRGDGRVSRRHCQIVSLDGQHRIEDLESSNGTRVNGELTVRRPLFGGETLEIGSARFVFRCETADQDDIATVQ